MMFSRSGSFLVAMGLALVRPSAAQIMSVDLGHEFFKVALMRQGAPLEVVLNGHSKRKTPTAVSFFESIRAFGDDALAHMGKAPAKVPTFFHSLMNTNFTSATDVATGGAWWQSFGLGDLFYSFDLGYDEARGTPTFKLGDGNETSKEELLANIFYFAKKMSEDTAEGKKIKDLVVTVAPDTNLRYRQAIAAAGEIAGCRLLTLVHEGAAFAVQRAVDFTPEKGTSEIGLFYNLGSRKAEVTIVKFESRSAGMVAGKMAPVVTVLGSAMDYSIGGHLMDLKIAEVMLKKFQEKYPKLADGIAKNPRAMRKLVSTAQKTKAVLSANKQSAFIVESLYEDTDFFSNLKREDFEAMIAEMLTMLTAPIEKALASANLTMKDIQSVEVVGGAWRVPKVQQVLSEFLEQGKGSKLPLGQHLNGEEGAAMGSALVGANFSSQFRVKKIFFADITSHEYSVQVVSLTGSWEKNVTLLFPAGSPMSGKKKLSFSLEEDFAIKLFEDGVLLSEYQVTGLEEAISGKWKEYNTTGAPKISASVTLESSGLVEVKRPTATIEELYWVNVSVKKNTTTKADNETNASDKAEGTEANESTAADAADNATDNESKEDDYEVTQKQKKKKHEKKLDIKVKHYSPVPMDEEAIAAAKARLDAKIAAEDQVLAVAGLRNELEAAIYGSRDKLESSMIVKVSTEEQREEVTKLCTEYEEWMYEDGATKNDYEAKLGQLKDLLGPMEERAMELEARSELGDTVEEAINDMQATAAHIAKNMSWVSENKTAKLQEKTKEFEAWWTKKLSSQKSLPLYEAPAFTKSEVIEKMSSIQKEWEKLKKTKKPKAKAKAKAEKDDTGASSKASDAAEEAFPPVLADAEALLADVGKQKMDAVEKEDFDAAHRLKQQEKKLAAHVKSLKEKSEL